jgi:nucleoside-diphosphate-sugar epimerase
MKILIIGGTGVLSSALTAEALKQGIAVTMINRGRRRIPAGIELIKADKNDLATIVSKLGDRQFDAVIDFLCYTDAQTERSVKLYSRYTKQYFYISSCAVYDTASHNGKMADEETKKVNPVWKYSVDKWASEVKLCSLLKGTEIYYTIIRPCVTYGDTRIPYGIMPPYGYHWTLCARILAGKPVITWNGGNNRCNMTRVEDFAVGVVGLIGNPKAYNEAYNICGDETPTYNDVLHAVGEILNKDVITVDISPEFYAKECSGKSGEILGGRAIDTINSNKKIKEIVPQFQQTISLKEGIARTIEAYKNNNYQKGIDWNFDANTDRIIKKICLKRRADYKQYKLSFIDYLGNAKITDRVMYWKKYYQDSLFMKAVKRIKCFIHC